jgi:serine/threonine protein phosphatase PrpC
MLETFGLTHPGRVRKNNEDYYLILPELGLYLVADGMGGARAGEQASRMAGESVASYLQQSGRRDAAALLEAFEEAHRQVQVASANDPAREGMGTTLITGLEAGGQLLIASVGDSRGYMFRDQQLLLLTDDQTWIEEIGRSLGLNDTDLRNHPMRHVLTMAIGARTPLKIHQYAVPLQPGAQFLLSSDGLHGVVGAEIIAKVLNSEQTLEAKSHYLLDAAIEAGGPDNITMILLRVV